MTELGPLGPRKLATALSLQAVDHQEWPGQAGGTAGSGQPGEELGVPHDPEDLPLTDNPGVTVGAGSRIAPPPVLGYGSGKSSSGPDSRAGEQHQSQADTRREGSLEEVWGPGDHPSSLGPSWVCRAGWRPLVSPCSEAVTEVWAAHGPGGHGGPHCGCGGGQERCRFTTSLGGAPVEPESEEQRALHQG